MMLSKAISAAAVAYSLIALIYGRAEYAAVGAIEFDTSWLETIIPAVAAIAYPLLSRCVPGWSLISKTLSWVLPKPSDETPDIVRHLLDLLRAINALEERAAARGDIETSALCGAVRKQLVTQLMVCNTPADEPVSDDAGSAE